MLGVSHSWGTGSPKQLCRFPLGGPPGTLAIQHSRLSLRGHSLAFSQQGLVLKTTSGPEPEPGPVTRIGQLTPALYHALFPCV